MIAILALLELVHELLYSRGFNKHDNQIEFLLATLRQAVHKRQIHQPWAVWAAGCSRIPFRLGFDP